MQGSHQDPEHLEDVPLPPEVPAGGAGRHPGAVCLEEGPGAAELPGPLGQHCANPESLPQPPGVAGDTTASAARYCLDCSSRKASTVYMLGPVIKFVGCLD